MPNCACSQIGLVVAALIYVGPTLAGPDREMLTVEMAGVAIEGTGSRSADDYPTEQGG
jgi:hypothetical protein